MPRTAETYIDQMSSDSSRQRNATGGQQRTVLTIAPRAVEDLVSLPTRADKEECKPAGHGEAAKNRGDGNRLSPFRRRLDRPDVENLFAFGIAEAPEEQGDHTNGREDRHRRWLQLSMAPPLEAEH